MSYFIGCITCGPAAGSADGKELLYANGNQQIRVAVTVAKVDILTGDPVPLSLSEMESINITAAGNDAPQNDIIELPDGYSVSKTPNGYTEYTRNVRPGSGTFKCGGPHVHTEYFYVSSTTTESSILCSYIKLDEGGFFCSNDLTVNGPGSFEISPKKPYLIKTSNVYASKIADIYTGVSVGQYTRGQVVNIGFYKWVLPDGISIKELNVINEYESDDNLYYYQGTSVDKLFGVPQFYLGMVLLPSINEITVGEVCGWAPDDLKGDKITLAHGASGSEPSNAIRGLLYFQEYSSYTPNWNRDMTVSVTDNYGCVSPFVLCGGTEAPYDDLTMMDG